MFLGKIRILIAHIQQWYQYGSKNLCLAGGVALNCVANGILKCEKIFDNIWIQPAAGDAGGSLGAALAYWHRELDKPREDLKDKMKGSYLGPLHDASSLATIEEISEDFFSL